MWSVVRHGRTCRLAPRFRLGTEPAAKVLDGVLETGGTEARFRATLPWEHVKFQIGDRVVYPAYGVGRIALRDERLVAGAKEEVLVLELADGLSVTLTVEHANRVLRPLLSESDIVVVQKTLREDQTLSGDGWLKRKRGVEAKVIGGDPAEMAEVVRDGARRERGLQAKKTGSQLSPSERDLYLRARRLLSSEIGSVRGLEPDAADAWIDEQLGPRPAQDGLAKPR